jgi:hypothetical protein
MTLRLSTFLVSSALFFAAACSSGTEPLDPGPADAGARDRSSPDAPAPDVPDLPDSGIFPDAEVDGPDLTVTFLPSPWSLVWQGQNLLFDILIANRGTRPAAAGEVRAFLCLAPCRNASLTGLEAGAVSAGAIAEGGAVVHTLGVLVPADLPPGDWELYAYVDLEREIDEIEEENNVSAPVILTVVDLFLSSPWVSFGPVLISCPEHREITLENHGPALNIFSIEYSPESSPEFSTTAVAPIQVARGGSLAIGLDYLPVDLGDDSGTLRIYTNRVVEPLEVDVHGEGASEVEVYDTFTQEPPKLDILFVMDDSCSMGEEQVFVANNMDEFLDFAAANMADWQVGVTTTDDGLSSGHFVGPIVTPSTPLAENVLQDQILVGQLGSALERGLRASELALSEPVLGADHPGFLRADASLAIVYVSDEEDSSPETVEHYETFLRGLKSDPSRISVAAIAGDVPGGCSGIGGSAYPAARYVALVQAFGGVFHSICDFSDLSDVIGGLGGPGFGRRWRFELSRLPDPATIAVSFDGVAVPAIDPGGNELWRWVEAVNAIDFSAAAIPEAGANVLIRYYTRCES